MFVDSHAHLDGERFDADRDQVIARAHDSGVQTIVAIGTGDGPGTLDSAIKVAEKYQGIYATVGIHPHEASLASEADFEQLETLAKSPKVIAWGEIGLDYFYDHSPREIQQQVFIRQMQMARAAKLPIVIHCRPSENSGNAWEDCLALIDQHWKSGGMGGVLHCFTGSAALARAALDVGDVGGVQPGGCGDLFLSLAMGGSDGLDRPSESALDGCPVRHEAGNGRALTSLGP